MQEEVQKANDEFARGANSLDGGVRRLYFSIVVGTAAGFLIYGYCLPVDQKVFQKISYWLLFIYFILGYIALPVFVAYRNRHCVRK